MACEVLAAKGQLDYLWTAAAVRYCSGRSMIQHIERQFVRTSRPLYSHLVGLLESAISRGDFPSGARVPPERELAQRLGISAPPSSAPTASWNRAACCAAMSAAAPSSAPRPILPARRSPGAARSPPRRCARATRPCATRSGTRPMRECSRSPPASRRSTAFPPRRFSTPSIRSLKREGRRGLAAWPDRRAADASRGHRRALRRAGRERADSRRRAAGARSAGALPDRSRRRRDRRSPGYLGAISRSAPPARS